MAAAAAPYTAWLNAAAAQATGAAGQAQAVIDAFEATRAATIHPLMVEANRNGLVQLMMSNFFGQNWPAISAMEADYEAYVGTGCGKRCCGYHAAAVGGRRATGAVAAVVCATLIDPDRRSRGPSPITDPVPGDPASLVVKRTNLRPILNHGSAADPDDNNFVAVVFSSSVLHECFDFWV